MEIVTKMSTTENEYSLTGAPNKNYEKFFLKLKEIETVPVEKWSANHLIGYFAQKYKEHYHTKYKFKFNTTAPSSCFEVWQMKKLSNMLSSNPTILKGYIDWVFLNRVAKAKKKLTSISFLTVEGIVNEYKINVVLADKHDSINRSTTLPSHFASTLNQAGIEVKTYGDLAFAYQIDPMPEDFKVAFSQIESQGFDKGILGKLA